MNNLAGSPTSCSQFSNVSTEYSKFSATVPCCRACGLCMLMQTNPAAIPYVYTRSGIEAGEIIPTEEDRVVV